MRVFVAGASGVVGRLLVPRLCAAGHDVTAMTRDQARAATLASMGVTPVTGDVYDADGLTEVVRAGHPEVVVHQLTSLPKVIDPRQIGTQFAANDRIRIEGTRNLVRAAVAAGARRLVAQSVSFAYTPEGGWVKAESDPLWLEAPGPFRRSVAALAELERQVLAVELQGLEGVVLRYGYFYGPGTAYGSDGAMAGMVRRRRFPIVGGGHGVFSFVHVDDAAAAAVDAVDRGAPGIYNIVDDEPSPVREWLPVYAEALGAPAPRRVPVWLARWVAGDYAVYLSTRQRGASNGKARRELGWTPAASTWRTGFRAALGVEG